MAAYRRQRAAAASGTTVSAAAADDPWGDVFLVIDGWATIRADYDDLEPIITDLATRGLSYGIHLVAAAPRWLDFRPAVRDLFGSRLELRLGDAERLADLPQGGGQCADGRARPRFDRRGVALPRRPAGPVCGRRPGRAAGGRCPRRTVGRRSPSRALGRTLGRRCSDGASGGQWRNRASGGQWRDRASRGGQWRDRASRGGQWRDRIVDGRCSGRAGGGRRRGRAVDGQRSDSRTGGGRRLGRALVVDGRSRQGDRGRLERAGGSARAAAAGRGGLLGDRRRPRPGQPARAADRAGRGRPPPGPDRLRGRAALPRLRRRRVGQDNPAAHARDGDRRAIRARGGTDRAGRLPARAVGLDRTDHVIGYGTSGPTTEDLIASVAGYMERRLPGPDVTPEELRSRSWWTGPQCFVLVDDYDLVAAGSSNPLQPLADYLSQARDIGLHLVIARRSGGASRAMYEPILQRLRELSSPGLVMSGDRDEGALVGGVAAGPAPAGSRRVGHSEGGDPADPGGAADRRLTTHGKPGENGGHRPPLSTPHRPPAPRRGGGGCGHRRSAARVRPVRGLRRLGPPRPVADPRVGRAARRGRCPAATA